MVLKMKRLITCILGAFCVMFSNAQNVNLRIIDGIDAGVVKSNIEKNASALLSEINRAQRSGRSELSFDAIAISDEAKKSLKMLWSAMPFYCEDSEVVESITELTRKDGDQTVKYGYQIRNIHLELAPTNTTYSGDTYQEAVIDFDKNGRIQRFCFPMINNMYRRVVLEGNHVGDYSRREMILGYVDDFRKAYEEKDIHFLEQVFSDDALIITGKVIKTKPNDFNPISQDKVIRITKSKREYLDNLKDVFRKNQFIKVTFDNIEIYHHPNPKKSEFYGVSLRQGYKSSTYSDDGYLFLLWDFRDEDRPQIHVRVWEAPNGYINGTKFSLEDIDLTDIE